MIQLSNINKSFGGQTLFNGLNFQMTKGQKIGLIGRNGTGKSTLFKIILGEEQADSGDVIIPRNYRIGTLRQHLHFTETTVAAECALVLGEDEQYNFYKIEKILFGLGFSESDLEKDPLSFSGGYQIRINLAKLLATEPNMLLLDEPTNYLDILSLRWLEQFIREFDGEVIIITHDRTFMDSVITHTMGIQRKTLNIIKGTTKQYEETLAMQDETYEKTRLNQEKKRKDLEEFIARNKARASTANLAQSKVKILEKMDDMESLESESSLSFKFNYKVTPAKVVLRAEDLGFGYDPTAPLFQHLTFALEVGQTLAIIGKNGKGKSTLLNYIAGELPNQQGSLEFHPSTNIAHFGQTNIERLNLKNNIIEEISSADKNIAYSSVRNICGTMMFTGDSAEKKIEVLSGGERSRVMLGKIIATPANLLLLDEPTNHLDMQSIDALCDAVEGFEGAVIMVTHSELMLRRLADSLIIFHEGRAEYFGGTYDEFLEKIGWEEEAGDAKPKKAKPKLDKKERKALRAAVVQAKSKELAPLKKEIRELELKMVRIENDLSEATQNLAIATLNSDLEVCFDKLATLTEQLDAKSLPFDEQLSELD